MTTDRFKDGIQWWMDTTQPMSTALYPNPPQWHIDTGNLVRLVPQRPWAGLTEDEMSMIGYAVNGDEFEAMRLVEAKLRSKNT